MAGKPGGDDPDRRDGQTARGHRDGGEGFGDETGGAERGGKARGGSDRGTHAVWLSEALGHVTKSASGERGAAGPPQSSRGPGSHNGACGILFEQFR